MTSSDNLMILDTRPEDGSRDPRIDVVSLSLSSQLLALPQQDALKYAQEEFQRRYQHAPQFVARAPGRVNLIGEHIDYNGFGVLPMALQQSVFVATSCQQTKSSTDESSLSTLKLHIQSTSPGANPCHVTYNVPEILSKLASSSQDPPFDASQRDWSHYVLCAIFGILEKLQATPELTNKLQPPKQSTTTTISLLIHGTVPQGAGVSSSSALVVASAMATLAVLELQATTLSKSQMAMLCARCERWVGTEGGGMDQAISILGQGQYIQFQPTFASQAITLPSASWVVCHSLEESHKRVDAATNFNKRVIECKVACRYLAQQVLPKNADDEYPSLLWEVVRASDLSFSELEAVAKEHVPETVSRAEVVSFVLGEDATATADATTVMNQVATKLGVVRQAGIEVLRLAESYRVRDRLLHVLSETRRVQSFVTLCGCQLQQPNDTEETALLLDALGKLLNQSHASCSDWYECSSEKLNQLQQTCLQAPGTLGSRMTGAGWGGCVISLVHKQNVEEFCGFVREQYYATLPEKPKKEADYIFVTVPSPGSCVFDSRS